MTSLKYFQFVPNFHKFSLICKNTCLFTLRNRRPTDIDQALVSRNLLFFISLQKEEKRKHITVIFLLNKSGILDVDKEFFN